jgi:hypothetical protein
MVCLVLSHRRVRAKLRPDLEEAMDKKVEPMLDRENVGDAPGIVIHDRFEPVIRPAILAFIWGGKVKPVPQLPYGRVTA